MLEVGLVLQEAVRAHDAGMPWVVSQGASQLMLMMLKCLAVTVQLMLMMT